MQYWRYFPPFSWFTYLKERVEDYKFRRATRRTIRQLRRLGAQLHQEGEELAKAVEQQAEKLAEDLAELAEVKAHRKAIFQRQLRRRGEHDY